MVRKAQCVVLLCATLMLGGCAQREPLEPVAVTRQVVQQEYVIEAGDEMDVKFFYSPELNESVTVRPDGRISLQLAHEVRASGLTPAELTAELARRYSRELGHPEVAVILRSFSGQRVFVDGEVNRPSLVSLRDAKTVLQSLSVAGGLKESANRSQILVIRRLGNDTPRPLEVDLSNVLSGTEPDLSLMPADIVFVPKSGIANLNVWVDQYLRKNLPVGFGLSYQVAGP